MEFGEKLKSARQSKGFTQQTLAEKLYVTRQAVSRWECGARYPDLLTAKKISQILNVTIDELLSEEELRENIEREPLLARPAENIGQTCLYTIAATAYLLMSVFGVYSILTLDRAPVHTQSFGLLGAVSIAENVFHLAVLLLGLFLSIKNKLSAKMTGDIMCVPYVMAAFRFLATYIDMRMRQNGVMSMSGWIMEFVLPLAIAVYILLYFRTEERRLPYAVIAIVCLVTLGYISLVLKRSLVRPTDIGFVVMTVHGFGKFFMIILLGYQGYIWDKKKMLAYRNDA